MLGFDPNDILDAIDSVKHLAEQLLTDMFGDDFVHDPGGDSGDLVDGSVDASGHDLPEACSDFHPIEDPLVHFAGNLHVTGDEIFDVGVDVDVGVAGFQGVEPHCGIHAVGNMVQAFYPSTGEEINQQIFNLCAEHGGLWPTPDGKFALDMRYYETLLEQVFHIPVHWEHVDTGSLLEHLGQNKMAVIAGDPHFLDPTRYPPGGYHAFNITGASMSSDGELLFRGFDSNIPGRIMTWTNEQIRASLDCIQSRMYGVNALLSDVPVPT